MSWIRRIFISLAIALFAVCCGAVLLFNWGASGYKALSVPTGSMRPNIPPGSVVLMHRVPYSTLRVGDVITYTNPLNAKTTVTHRIIKIDNKSIVPIYTTKGDANPTADSSKVIAGQVQGRAVWHAPHIGTVLSWSKTWLGIAVLVYLPAAIIMWGSAKDMADQMRKFQLYELKLFRKTRRFHLPIGRRTGAATLLVTLFVLILGTIAGPVQALLRSNTVALSPNNLRVAPRVTPPPPPICTNTTNNNSTTINNANNQTANTGNATNSNNTTGGNASSGNASNSNSTTITVTNTNCH